MLTFKILLVGNLLTFLLLVLDAQTVSLITALLTFIVSMTTLFINHSQNKKIKTVADTQEVIHKQINGQESALLQLTEKAGILTGNAEGRAELLQEQATPAAVAISTKVEVVNPPDNPVIVKPLDKIK